MKELIEALYSRFLLRDLFAKIVPGTLAALGVVIASRTEGVLDRAFGVVGWVVLGGTAWLIGLALQEAGQALGAIRFHDSKLTADEYRMRRVRAHREASDRESGVLERFLVIKEAAAVGALGFAGLAAGLVARVAQDDGRVYEAEFNPFAGSDPVLTRFGSATLTGAVVLAAVLLWAMHRRMSRVEGEYIGTILTAGSGRPEVQSMSDQGLA